jgi:hypothetical protein
MLIGLVLLSLVGGVVVRIGLGAERSVRLAEAAAHTERSFDTALDFLESELADAGTDGSGTDLVRLGRDSLTWRATRGVGLACQVTATEVRLLQHQWSASRFPQPGRDSLMLYVGADSLGADSVPWLVLPILGVSTASCVGAAALSLQTVLDTAQLSPGVRPLLVPARVFEIMQVRLYSSLGAWWFGTRSVSAGEGIQPVVGPLSPGGLQFTFRDSTGQVTATPAEVRSISALLKGAVAGRPDSAAVALAPGNLIP